MSYNELDKFPNPELPCENCIVLAMCKQRQFPFLVDRCRLLEYHLYPHMDHTNDLRYDVEDVKFIFSHRARRLWNLFQTRKWIIQNDQIILDPDDAWSMEYTRLFPKSSVTHLTKVRDIKCQK
jgi:hypothetical protein